MTVLRDYQATGIDRIRSAARMGSRAICAVAPTGAGKTQIGAEIVRACVAKGHHALWLAHRVELIDQAITRLREHDLIVGAACATSQNPPNPYAPVQVGSVQTLLARNLRPRAQVVILDEAHHFVADEFHALARDYPDSLVIGLTATPERGDGRGLGALFSRLVVVSRVRELVAEKYLVPSQVIAPKDKLRAGTIAQKPVDAYKEHAAGRSTIVFAGSVEIAERYAQDFRDAGIEARCIHGETDPAERALYLDAFKRGAFPVLTNCYVLTEGTDIPICSCIIISRSCGTAGTYLQMVGRGLRTYPGKADCVILDLHGVSHVHGHPEDDRQYSLEGRGIRRDTDTPVDTPYCRVCGCPIQAGETCPECGTAPRTLEPPRVTGEKLIPYARKRAENDDARAKTLARWISVGAKAGYKPNWAKAKYRAVYGTWPAYAIEQTARAILAGEKVA